MSKINEDPHSKWMKLALREAELAEQKDEVPVGAVLIGEDQKILAKAHNLRERKQSPVSHAEIETLLKASKKLKSWRLEGSVLYVTLEPCPMCLAACQQARVSKIIYGASDLKGGAMSLGYLLHEDRRTHHRFEVELFRMPECSKILSDFFRKKRKKPL